MVLSPRAPCLSQSNAGPADIPGRSGTFSSAHHPIKRRMAGASCMNRLDGGGDGAACLGGGVAGRLRGEDVRARRDARPPAAGGGGAGRVKGMVRESESTQTSGCRRGKPAPRDVFLLLVAVFVVAATLLYRLKYAV